MVDTENGLYWIDIMNFSNIFGDPSTSLLHLSKTPDSVQIDLLWLGGLLRLFGFNNNKNEDSE